MSGEGTVYSIMFEGGGGGGGGGGGLSRKNCTGRKLYRAVHFWLPNLYRPGTLLVAKSVPALPKVYRPGTILVTKSVPVLPKVCRVEH